MRVHVRIEENAVPGLSACQRLDYIIWKKIFPEKRAKDYLVNFSEHLNVIVFIVAKACLN